MVPEFSQRFHPALESLRGICAVMVVLTHLPWTWHLQDTAIVTNSWLFVDFFFVLSGFVIASAHGFSDRNVGAARRFLIRRAFRLYPLHLLTLVAMVVLIASRNALIPGGGETLPPLWLIAANVAAVQSWGFTDTLVLNAPSWSISTEIAAYLLFAAVCLAIARPGRRAAAMGVAAMISVTVLVVLGNGTLDPSPHLRALRCFYGFGIGVVIWYLIKGRTAKVGILWPVVAGLVVAGLLLGPAYSLAMPVIFAGVVAVGALDSGSPVKRLLETRPLRRVGELSYSIYMLHVPILSVLGAGVGFAVKARAEGKIATDPWIGDILLLLALAVIILCSGLVYRFVEEPWRKRGRALTAEARDRKNETAADPGGDDVPPMVSVGA